MPVRWTDIHVRHTGYTDPAFRAKKLERDRRILLGELGERPNDPFVLFNLGMIAHEHKEWASALGYLERSLAGSAPGDSITRKLYALIARVQQMLGDTGGALHLRGWAFARPGTRGALVPQGLRPPASQRASRGGLAAGPQFAPAGELTNAATDLFKRV